MEVKRASANTVMNRLQGAARVFACICLLVSGLASAAGSALADSYADTIGLFKEAGASVGFFKASYAYAAFPTIGKGGFLIGGARGMSA